MIGSASADSIGNVVEATGNSGLLREQEQVIVTPAYLPEVELYDTATTGNSRMLIQFLDKSYTLIAKHVLLINKPCKALWLRKLTMLGC